MPSLPSTHNDYDYLDQNTISTSVCLTAQINLTSNLPHQSFGSFMHSKNITTKFIKLLSIAFGVFGLALSFAVNRLQIGNGILDDRFHHGEYIASLSSIVHESSFVPLTIHGALDFIPGLLAIFVYGRESYLFPTQLAYLSLSLMSCIMALVITYRFTQSALQVLIAGFIVPYLVDFRDFSILLLLFFYFFLSDRKKLGSQYFCLFLLGLIGAFNFYFSTNRGIAGTISIGVALLISSYFNRAYLIAVASFLIFIFAGSLISPLSSFPNYISNILFLTQTSHQWSYGLDPQTAILSVFLATWLIAALYLQFIEIASMRGAAITPGPLPNFALFTLLSIFFFQIATYRADLPHIKMGLLAFLLSITYSFSSIATITWLRNKVQIFTLIFLTISSYLIFRQDRILGLLFVAYFLCFMERYQARKLHILLRFVIILLVCQFIFHFSEKFWDGYKNDQFKWTQFIVSSKSNNEAVESPVNWVAGELKRTNSRCIFDLTNNGVINGVADLPACTRFSYIIYADEKFEEEIIDSLSKSSPPALVYSSEYWSYSIDAKNMAARFPDLDAYIQKNYKTEKCNEGYCIRYKNMN